ncbi:unnamed protein product [Urochloa humidicola]
MEEKAGEGLLGALNKIKARLDTIEARIDGKVDPDAAAKAEKERRDAARERAYKEAADTAAKMLAEEGLSDCSSSIDDIVGKLINDAPPPKIAAAPSASSSYLKLTFPYYDGKEDPLPWPNKCEQFFVGHVTPEDKKVWYASYHLVGAAQQWFMRLNKERHIIDWSYFISCV